MNLFIYRLRLLLEQSGKLQKNICLELGISKQKLSKWKTGYNEPSLDELIIISNYFDVSVDYLLGREDELGDKTYASDGVFIDRIMGIKNRGDLDATFAQGKIQEQDAAFALDASCPEEGELFYTIKKLSNSNKIKLLGYCVRLFESQSDQGD